MISEILLRNISGITTKAACEVALMGERHVRIEISDFVMRTFILNIFTRTPHMKNSYVPWKINTQKKELNYCLIVWKKYFFVKILDLETRYGMIAVLKTKRLYMRWCKMGNKRLVINQKWCKGCGICAAFCPKEVLEIVHEKVSVKNEEACIQCGLCELRCPDYAIYIEKEEA